MANKDKEKLKALVVDDDGTNRLVLKGMLTKDGYEVVLAENGQQAVEKFEETSPDIVLMDVMMPVMDGYEATKIIKEKLGDRFVPIIFLTAMGGDEAMVSCLENGGDDYVKKPFTRTVLAAKIDAMNRIRRLYLTVHEQKIALAEQQKYIEREYEIAERIFSNIMSRGDSRLPFVKTHRESAETFNGDIVLAARSPRGGFSLLVGDFTGHGLAAAIGAMPVADTFFTMTAKGFDIDDIISEINKKVRQLLPTGRFLAAALLRVDSQCKTLQVWNGGMPELLVVNPNGNMIQHRIESSHVPLGVMSATEFDMNPQTIELTPGSRIVVFSDGVVETTNAEGEMFGLSRVEQVVTNESSRDRINDLKHSIYAYREDEAQLDDITMVEILCDPHMFFEMEESFGDHRVVESTNWKVSFIFEQDTLRKLDPIPLFMESIGSIQGLFAHKEKLFLILSELYNNSLEHGILKLDQSLKISSEGFTKYYEERAKRLTQLQEARIGVEFENRPVDNGGRLFIRMEDTGEGFDTTKVNNWDMQSNNGFCGRGVTLLRALCESVIYSEKGNAVEVVYRW